MINADTARQALTMAIAYKNIGQEERARHAVRRLLRVLDVADILTAAPEASEAAPEASEVAPAPVSAEAAPGAVEAVMPALRHRRWRSWAIGRLTAAAADRG
jgi:hypothetical protein